ncbi:MAG: acyl carrier protein [Acidobacteriota bacterium]
MDRQGIFDRIGTVIDDSALEDVEWADVSEQTKIESFGFDSLAVLDLLFDLEQEFGVAIEAKEMLALPTVGELVTLLGERGG